MGIDAMFWVGLIILLAALFYAAPRGGFTLGMVGGVGVILFVFVLGFKPGKPPVDVMLTILAVVCASSAMQAAGGLDCLLQIAEKALRRNPKYVCFLAPYICWFLTVLCGTGHVVYTMLPIVYDVAIKNGVRPERPMAASTIAAQMGIICSPAAVAFVTVVSYMEKNHAVIAGHNFTLFDLGAIVWPSAIVGLFCIGLFSLYRGKDLDKDEKFQALIADPEQKKYVYGETTTLIGKTFSKKQWLSLYIFLACVAIVALLGACKGLRPLVGKKPLSMTLAIQMFMLGSAFFTIVFCDAKNIAKTSVFNAGMVAIVSVFGVAWMADTLFSNYMPQLKAALTGFVQSAPWAYGIVLLIVSKLVNSQAAALVLVLPLAQQLGVSNGIILAMASACYGYYILPTYPSDLAAITFDRSGTTGIGKFVINHSFILPGLIGVGVATCFGYALGIVLGYI